MIDKKKYLLTFILTVTIFVTAFYLSAFLSDKRVESIKQIQDNISIDILSSEAQFDLLKEVSCANLNSSILAPEIGELGDKLSRTETDRGAKDEDILYLKKYYSLLQVKDYILSKNLGEKCASKKPVFIIYFYSNEGDCSDCTKEGYVLTFLKEKHPDLRVYSFDYNLQMSAVNSLKTIYKIPETLPAIVIEDKTYTGYKSLEELEKLLPKRLLPPTKSAVSKANIQIINIATSTLDKIFNREETVISTTTSATSTNVDIGSTTTGIQN